MSSWLSCFAYSWLMVILLLMLLLHLLFRSFDCVAQHRIRKIERIFFLLNGIQFFLLFTFVWLLYTVCRSLFLRCFFISMVSFYRLQLFMNSVQDKCVSICRSPTELIHRKLLVLVAGFTEDNK